MGILFSAVALRSETAVTRLALPVPLIFVLVRTLRGDHRQGLFGDSDPDYAAFATNKGMHEMDALGVLSKHRKRADVENCIPELKNGISLRRFQKKDVLHFAKRLRNKLIFLPYQVVKHAPDVARTRLRVEAPPTRTVGPSARLRTRLNFGTGNIAITDGVRL